MPRPDPSKTKNCFLLVKKFLVLNSTENRLSKISNTGCFEQFERDFIQATPMLELKSGHNDPDISKEAILRDANIAEQKGVKIQFGIKGLIIFMIVEAETFEAIDEMFEPYEQ